MSRGKSSGTPTAATTKAATDKAVTLAAEFYDRDPRRVARALLGKVVIRKSRGKIIAGRIVETEAYLGSDDAASHSAVGKTARNAVLFGPPGRAYIYFIYGNHYCLNVSCLPDGVAGGVLFRALEPVAGIEEMARARGIEIDKSEIKEALGETPFSKRTIRLVRSLTSGPGRLCEAFDITRVRDNDKDLTSPRSDLQIADDGYRVKKIAVTPRIGITKSADELLRYIIAGNPFVSGPAASRLAIARPVPLK